MGEALSNRVLRRPTNLLSGRGDVRAALLGIVGGRGEILDGGISFCDFLDQDGKIL